MATSTTANGVQETMMTKLFVGGLPYHTTDESLRAFFQHFGSIEEAVVITDRNTGKSKGYGFVTMSDEEAAAHATEDPNPIIDGRKANVNLAYLGAKPRVFQPTYNGNGGTTAAMTTAACTEQQQQQQAVGNFPQVQYILTPSGYVATTSMPYNNYPTMAANQLTDPSQLYQTQHGLQYAASLGYQPNTLQAISGYGGVNAASQQAALAAKYMLPTASAYYTYVAPQMMAGLTQQQQLQQPQTEDRTQ